jgi:hypothetical protein
MKDASDDYGLKISRALAAVRQMHADVSKLLVDADGTIGNGKESVFSNYATKNMTYNVRAQYWMAWLVFRYYTAPDGTDPGLVDGITVLFFEGKYTEPMLLLGQIQYHLAPQQEVKSVCDGFELFKLCNQFAEVPDHVGKVLSGTNPKAVPTLRWFKSIAVPLYTITSPEDVPELMARVRAAEVPAGPEGQP